ncbi:hypothetical protein FA13DRAFT_1718577 [Coprinellus micaceus]|uniref:Uncharacterized protein n=1 Tax=Coprinellus micaceus TaxID=71717 RepID=A0A4Y7SDP0_COPMI|nr:hypothetical protein FA13DRAFT_1718577 [Coprinellus micaceus]
MGTGKEGTADGCVGGSHIATNETATLSSRGREVGVCGSNVGACLPGCVIQRHRIRRPRTSGIGAHRGGRICKRARSETQCPLVLEAIQLSVSNSERWVKDLPGLLDLEEHHLSPGMNGASADATEPMSLAQRDSRSRGAKWKASRPQASYSEFLISIKK